jgi:hypothetical protein
MPHRFNVGRSDGVEDEDPVEKAHEDLHERAEHSREPWIGRVALTAALLAALAAVASSLSAHHESEGVLEQIKASDKWAYYQAKGIKADILKALKPESPDISRYAQEQKEIRAEATAAQEASEAHMKLHALFARSVTFSQIAIAIAAITVLTRRQWFWLVSVGFGAVGLAFFTYGLALTHSLKEVLG